MHVCFVIQLINEIISEYGIDDLDLFQQRLKKMRILENIELTNSVMELLSITEETPAVDPVKEIDVDDTDVKATEKEDGDDDDDYEVVEEEQEEDNEEPSVEEDTSNKIELKFKVDPKLPMMVRMANLCVVGGFSVNGVAEIHSKIVKEEVFDEFYKVVIPADSFSAFKDNYFLGISAFTSKKIKCSSNFFIITFDSCGLRNSRIKQMG